METQTKAGQNIGSAITAGRDVHIHYHENTSVGIEDEQLPEELLQENEMKRTSFENKLEELSVSPRKNEAEELWVMVGSVIKILESQKNPNDIKFLWERIENRIKSMNWQNVLCQDQHTFCSKLYRLTKKFIQHGNTETARNSIRCELCLIKLFYAPGKQRLEKLQLLGVSMQKIADKEKDSGRFKSEYSFMENILNEMLDVTVDDVDIELKCKLITAFCISYAYCCIETGNFNKAIEILHRAIYSMHLVFGKKFVHHEDLAKCYHNVAVSYQRLELLQEAEKAYELAKQFEQRADGWKPKTQILKKLEKAGPIFNGFDLPSPDSTSV